MTSTRHPQCKGCHFRITVLHGKDKSLFTGTSTLWCVDENKCPALPGPWVHRSALIGLISLKWDLHTHIHPLSAHWPRSPIQVQAQALSSPLDLAVGAPAPHPVTWRSWIAAWWPWSWIATLSLPDAHRGTHCHSFWAAPCAMGPAMLCGWPVLASPGEQPCFCLLLFTEQKADKV